MQSTIVDSTPIGVTPPSRIRSTRPSRSASTCAAEVGLGREKRFALGAATGTPQVSISARATRCAGTRTATDGRPAVTASGTAGFLEHKGERSRPERQRQRARRWRNAGSDEPELPHVRDVHDERVGGGAPLRFEDPLHGRRVERWAPRPYHRSRSGMRPGRHGESRPRPPRSPVDPAAPDPPSPHASSSNVLSVQHPATEQQFDHPAVPGHSRRARPAT